MSGTPEHPEAGGEPGEEVKLDEGLVVVGSPWVCWVKERGWCSLFTEPGANAEDLNRQNHRMV